MNTKVIFNIPNTIGYFRIFLLYISSYFNNIIFVGLYSLSASLDALDGKMARKYNQSTFLGACLDMITDRVSTILIFMKIIANDNSWNYFLFFTILTDIISHFLYFSYAISTKEHHKNPKNYFLRMYYRKYVLMFLCTASEIFFILLYLNSKYGHLRIICMFFSITSCIKTFFHCAQLYVALCGLSLHELKVKN